MAGRRRDIRHWASRRRAAVIFRVLEISPKFVEIAGETVAWIEVEVEAAYHGFVVGADAAGDSAEGRRHLGGLLGFDVVVDKNNEGEREGFDGEDVDGLLDIIVEDLEVGLF